jgi:hypothetical protein
MKKIYEEAIIEIISFEAKDVLTDSNDPWDTEDDDVVNLPGFDF